MDLGVQFYNFNSQAPPTRMPEPFEKVKPMPPMTFMQQTSGPGDFQERMQASPLPGAGISLPRSEAFPRPCQGMQFAQAPFQQANHFVFSDGSPQALQIRSDGQGMAPIGQSFGQQDGQGMSPNWQPHKVYLPQALTSFLVVGEAHQDMSVPSPNSQSSPIHVQAIPMPVGTPYQRDGQAMPMAPATMMSPMHREGQQAYPVTAPGAPVMSVGDFQAFSMGGAPNRMPQDSNQAFVVAQPSPAAPLQREWQAYGMTQPFMGGQQRPSETQAFGQPFAPTGQMPLDGQVTAPLPPGVPSEGSIGHPELCRRPCFYFAKGCCENGADCGYCHAQHGDKAPKLDKRQRLVLQSLPENMLLEMLMSRVQEKAGEKGMTAAMTEILELWQKRLAALAMDPPVVSPEDAENLAERYVRNLDKILRRMNISELIALAIRPAKEEQGYVGELRQALSRLRTKVPRV